MSEIETRGKLDRDNYVLLLNSEKHNCFGCSTKNSSGLQMKFYTNKEVDLVVSWYSVSDQFCGWSNLVHGGIISTLLDEAMGWGAIVIMQKLLLSKTIEVEFISPILTNTEIRVEGSVLKVNSEREAVMQGRIYNKKNELCAKSSSLISLFAVETIRKMGVLDEEMLGEMDRLIDFVSSIK